jgi:hypothetical protein
MSRKQKVLKVEKKIALCKRPILKCFQTCGKISCRKMAGFHAQGTFSVAGLLRRLASVVILFLINFSFFSG